MPRWIGLAPLLIFTGAVLVLPVIAIGIGAFTGVSETGASQFTTANVATSFQGPYLESLIGSIKLSALAATLSTIVGLPLAYAIATSRFRGLREAVLSASGVIANFGGVPLAFAFVATLGNAGVLTGVLRLDATDWSLYSFGGLTVVYLYFLIPLMVLTLTPAVDGLKRQWREAAQNNRATGLQYWVHVAIPVLLPALLSGFVLLFGSAFSAYSTAAAIMGDSIPLVTMKIAAALSGDVLVDQGNIALALSLDMILVAVVVMATQFLLQKRSSAWLS